MTLGTPNACTQCHAGKKPIWAAAQIEKWYGHSPRGYQRFAEAFHAATRSAAGAAKLLRDVVRDPEQSAIAHASALARLVVYRDPATLDILGRSLNDADAMVRLAAVGALAQADPTLRARSLPRLADPVRGIRMEAARAAGHPSSTRGGDRDAFAKALDEYIAGQQFVRPSRASRISARSIPNAGTPHGPRHGSNSLSRSAGPTPAVVNLADIYRALGREDDAEVVRDALTRAPRDATHHHVLGLSLARQKPLQRRGGQFAKAAQLATMRAMPMCMASLHSTGKVPRQSGCCESTALPRIATEALAAFSATGVAPRHCDGLNSGGSKPTMRMHSGWWNRCSGKRLFLCASR